MKKENLALSDFSKNPAVFDCGLESTRTKEQDVTCLPVCRAQVKVTAKTIKLVKPRKVSAK